MTSQASAPGAPLPLVSVIVANHNGAQYLADCLASILAQSFPRIEVVLVDDASTDRSLAIAEGFAARDGRLAIHRLARNRGPAAARNAGLAVARGTWIAIVDSDDIIHPDRIRQLVAAAETAGADIVADDMMIFRDDHAVAPSRLLSGALTESPSWITPAQYVRANQLFAHTAPLGYLKPLIRGSVLAAHRVRYDEDLRIAEDYDLVLRLLVRGARFRLIPELLYFYRQHSASISYRLNPEALAAMTAADGRFRAWAGPAALIDLEASLDARLASIRTAAASEAAIAGLKARRPLAVLSVLARHPAVLPILGRLLAPSRLLARLRRPTPPPAAVRPVICILSRQRLAPGASGSAAYLLSLCASLRDMGFALLLICPSPAVLGRVPVLRIAGDGSLFDHVAVRGTWRIGRVLFAQDPRVYLRAALGVADRLARRAGVRALARVARPAPYAVGLPWTADDGLFVAAQARGQADIVLADYCFLTPGIPYALGAPGASAVVMHDLFSSRPLHFAALGATDSVAALDEATEAGLLGRAALVIAIQHEEAASVRRMLPAGPDVLVAPMAVVSVGAPQPGEGGGLLFVGSATMPNVDAMRWFLAEIWPLIRVRRHDARLVVAGSVCTALDGALPAGVILLGRVAQLADHYRRADVVIAPLRVGSGLKIKLVEALAHGKPVVATRLTAQGITEQLGDCVVLADTASDFANATLALLAAPAARAACATAALDAAKNHFSAQIAYGGVIAHLCRQYEAASALRMIGAAA